MSKQLDIQPTYDFLFTFQSNIALTYITTVSEIWRVIGLKYRFFLPSVYLPPQGA